MTGTKATPPSTSDELARYRRYLIAEWDAAALYRRLADAEPDPVRAGVLRQLAQMELAHAARWEGRLRAAGEDLPNWRPAWRARALAWLARVFGTRAVLPVLEALEGGDADMYAREPGAEDFSAQERSHRRIFAGLRGKRRLDPVGADEAERHRRGSGNLRAAIFGVNDGLVSNLSLVMGVAGADPGAGFVLLAGLAGLLGGAFSMATGEYISVLTQRERLERELEVERAELEEDPEEEEQELALIYRAKGLAPEEASRVARQLISNKETALDTLAREELGLDPRDLGDPKGAAISSFVSFGLGAVVPVLPYVLKVGGDPVIASAALSGVVLFSVGVAAGLLTGRPLLLTGGRMLLFGAAAALVTYLAGRLLGVAAIG
jgi:vacuolar iron transporter family protein